MINTVENSGKSNQGNPDGKVTKLWNLSFTFLWQGQFVSGVGDFFYQIALGFWVLAVTGSTALMATIMAASLVPQILFSPFAGVVVDRASRRSVIIWMDVLRGLTVLLITVAAFWGVLKIWMVFIGGLVLGICLSFFNPAVRASIADIVPRTKLIKANAAFSMIYASSKIIGDSMGGLLFQVIGIPFLFMINALSYFFSAFTALFIKIPNVHHDHPREHFFKEMKDGLLFTWQFKGLRHLFINAWVTNLFSIMGYTLILPLFQKNAKLGPGLYGIVMGTAAVGALACLLISSAVHYKPKQRFLMMCILGGVYSLSRMIFPFFLNLYIMLPLMFIAGFSLSIPLIFLDASISETVPADKRGKVFALLNTVTTGVWPLGMVLAGTLAEFFSIPILIATASAISLLSYGLLLFSDSARDVINFESAKHEHTEQLI